jgi:3-oxoadipate enol-lactonase
MPLGWYGRDGEPSEMGYARVNGIDTYYEVAGSGPRLLLMNGSGATLSEASTLIAPFAEHFEVAAMDPRGLGRSSMSPEAYTMADLAADAMALLDHLEWERFSLMGLSFGGMLAQELAVTIPHRVDRMAVLCSSPGGAGRISFPLEVFNDMEPAERDATYPRLLDTRFTPDWLADHDNDRALIDLVLKRLGSEQPDEVRQGAAMQLEARAHHDVWDRLPRIQCPSLVAAGRFDGIAPPDNSRAIAQQIAGSVVRLFEGGHLFLIQDPAALPAVIDHLGGTVVNLGGAAGGRFPSSSTRRALPTRSSKVPISLAAELSSPEYRAVSVSRRLERWLLTVRRS